jgi:tRNA(Ile)-lysidine synthetase-like protein
MFELFMRTLTGQCSVRDKDSVLVCVSGGVDSMVLLELMLRAAQLMRLRIGVVHVDHGIRSGESQKDARFVLDRCSELSIKTYLSELKMGADIPNLEETARRRRYEAIMECKQQGGYAYAATGHTLDDQAETILYRIIRGTGIRGLAGMAYSRSDGLIRPLLGISRSQVEDFARSEGIRHVEDRTNDDMRLSRNLIRHTILPVMGRMNPRAVHSIARLAQIAHEEGGFVEETALILEEEACIYDWGIVKAFKVAVLENAIEAIVKRLIINVATGMIKEPRGIDAIQVNAILDVLKGRAAAHTLKRKMRVLRDGATLVFCTAQEGPYYLVAVHQPGPILIPEINACVHIFFPPGMAHDLRLRSYVRGDRMKGKRVSEILARMGVMSSLKPFWPVLASHGEIITVATRNKSSLPVQMILEEGHGQ